MEENWGSKNQIIFDCWWDYESNKNKNMGECAARACMSRSCWVKVCLYIFKIKRNYPNVYFANVAQDKVIGAVKVTIFIGAVVLSVTEGERDNTS